MNLQFSISLCMNYSLIGNATTENIQRQATLQASGMRVQHKHEVCKWELHTTSVTGVKNLDSQLKLEIFKHVDLRISPIDLSFR